MNKGKIFMKVITSLKEEINKRQTRLLSLEKEIEKRHKERELLVADVTRLKEAMRILERPIEKITENKQKHAILRSESEIARIRDILKSTYPQPMHVDSIIARLGEKKERKTSIVGSLNAYMKKGKIFKRTAPNTFTILNSNED
jgi:chromosome segregation ATPase